MLIVWIPTNVRIHGNEMADKEANEDSKLKQNANAFLLHVALRKEDMKPAIKEEKK